MDAMEILKHVDHTQLKAVAPWEEIEKLCDEAIRYGNLLRMYPAVLCETCKGSLRGQADGLYGGRISSWLQCDTGEAGGNGAGIAGRSRGD